MLKFILSALVIAITVGASGQKQKIAYDKDTGMITVDGADYAQLTKENAPGQLGVNKNFTISNLEGKELIYMVFTQRDIFDARGRNTGKKEVFYVINFLESGRTARRNGTLGALGAAKLVAKNNLLVGDQIDPSAEDKFHMKF